MSPMQQPSYSRPDRKQLKRLKKWRAGKFTDYSSFIVLASPRTGSSWLISLLRSHPNVWAYGEIFNLNAIFAGIGRAAILRSPELLAMRDANPVDFTREYIFRGYAAGVEAVGYKIFYEDLARSQMDALLPDHEAQARFRVIHLRRRNLLKALVSDKIARSTQTWRNRVSQTVVQLTVEECARYFEKALSNQQCYAERLSGPATLDVYYEDLVDDLPAQTKRVLEHLQVPARELKSDIAKQEYRSMADVVENFAEIKSIFAGSDYAQFFAD